MQTMAISREDMNYLAQQSSDKLNLILSGMTSLMQDNDRKVETLESQNWFQRMCRTISGKNKMTRQEIQYNHDRINQYMTEAMSELYQQNLIDRQIMMSLGNQINLIYASQLELKQMLGAFVSKLNEKIESVDNFHILNTEIEQGVYSQSSPLVAICKIMSQMDRRCAEDERKLEILRRSMEKQQILSDTAVTLRDYLMSIVLIPMEEVGIIAMELGTLRGNFMADLILEMIDSYHFLPDMARKMKNKAALVENVIQNAQLEPEVTLSMEDVYAEFITSKCDMLRGFLTVPAEALPAAEEAEEKKSVQESRPVVADTSSGDDLQQAEKLFLACKMDEAYDKFLDLADAGNGRAMYFLGEYYVQEFSRVPYNADKAREWRMKGRDQGDALAALNVAYSLPKDSEERGQIFKEMFPKILELAKSGDVFAQNELADMYLYGYGTEADTEQGIRWLKKSAESGYWRSQNELGNCYYFGRGVAEDGAEAVRWYRKAAEQGYAEAQNGLGNCYYIGRGVAEDGAEAVRWYRKAAEQGHAEAQNSLGICYFMGKGVTKDKAEAVRWYQKAAEQGHVDAQYELGICYENGEGVTKDKVEAVQWFLKAAKQGHEKANIKLEEYSEMLY